MLLLELAILFSPIQSFVVTNFIKGLTLFNFFIILIALKKVIFFNKKFIKYMGIFLFLYFSFAFIQQLTNLLIIDLHYNILNNLIFISQENVNHLFFRKSFFTQTLYLIVDIIFFICLLQYLKRNGRDKLLKVAYFSIILFIVYGYYEFFFYLITHNNPDFISNRITGKDFHYGLFQTITIAGINIQRIKSLAGEPSMFAFTLLPFFILSIYLKKYIFSIISFITLLISTSTTAILGIFVFFLLDLIYGKNRIIKLVIVVMFFSIIIIFNYNIIYSLYLVTESKLTLQSVSGIQRFTYFYNHFNAWLNSDFFHKLFGYGFGYVRSTDGITTLLFNIGILGTIGYCMFFLLPYFLLKKKNNYIKGLYISNFVLLIIILISVPEFYYPQIWLFNALLWYEYIKEKAN